MRGREFCRVFTKYVTSSLLLGILLGGCSNAADQPAAAAASATPAPARSIGLAAGTVHLGRTVQGVTVEVDTFYADVSFDDYTNSAFAGYTNYDVANFSLGPWGAGSWRLPTQAELQRLRSYALAADSNPVLGLEAMGFDLGNAGSNNGFTDISFLCSDSGNVGSGGGSHGDYTTDAVVVDMATGSLGTPNEEQKYQRRPPLRQREL